MAYEFDDLIGDMPDPEPEVASDEIPIPALVTANELAALLGITNRAVQALATKGVFTRLPGKGRVARGGSLIDTRAAIRAYIDLKAGASKADLAAEKLRLTSEQADAQQLKNAGTRRELVPAAEVKAAWAEVLRDVRAAMLSVPSRVAQRLPHLTAADIDHIDREVRDALTESAK